MLGPDLPTSAAAATPQTVGGDALDASVRLARLRQQMFARVETPRIAQYHVLRQIGGGGMGLVFAAWDPALDRVIAIKVLRDPWAGAGDALRREAIALARLRHPNVVSVFEVGEHAGQVYLAMEYVEGETLRAWARRWHADPKRDVAALLHVFLQAADGLAAAHAAGLVHRDVKPENVMIDEQGRVRVMDFGLARSDARAESVHDLERASPSATIADSRGLVGTPAYMAPEQFDGVAPGPGADQFALMACLFETLYGRRARPERMEAAALVAAAPITVPSDRRVPRRLQAIVRRGLAIDPSARWPSMTALAHELRRLQQPRWIRWATAGAILVATAGVIAGVALASAGDAVCTGSDAEMATVWDPSRAAALATRVDAYDADFAADALQRLVPELDAYRAEWIEAHHETCDAAQRRREISTEQMDLRMACLDDRRRRLGALVDVVERGDAEALALAQQAVLELPVVAACSDAQYVGRQGYPDMRTDARLVLADAQRAAGAIEDARRNAFAALAEAEASGDGVAMAHAGLALGRAQQALFESIEAHATLVAAYEHARREHLGDVAVEAAIELVGVAGVDLSRSDEGQWWSRIAELDSAELGDPRLVARREQATAAMLDAAGHSRNALSRATTAHELLRDAAADPAALASARLQIGQLHLLTGDITRGGELIANAAASLAEALGPEHPGNAKAQRMLADAARLRGDVEGANRHAERALALTEAALGRDHIALMPMLEVVAAARQQAGQREDALAILDRALSLQRPRPLHDGARARLHARRADVLADHDLPSALAARELAYALARAAFGDQHRITVQHLAALGETLGAAGRTAEAIEKVGVALVIGESVLGAEHPDIVGIHASLALEYEREGRYERALEHHVARLELLERLHGPDAYPLAAAQNNVCIGLMRLERAVEAIPHCRRALAITELSRGESPRLAAELHNTLAGVLVHTGQLDEAERELAASRGAWQVANGPNSFEESTPILNLGEVAFRRGDDETACARYREGLAIREAKLGKGHASTEKLRGLVAACDE
jgi:tetratricopeptide (TPR) repeat protein